MYKCMGHKGTMTLSHEIWAFGSLKTGDTIFKYGHKMKKQRFNEDSTEQGSFYLVVLLYTFVHSVNWLT